MRRATGEGCVTQRKNGLWQGSLQVDGKRKTVYGQTRREVVDKLDELRRQASVNGALADPGSRTVGDLLDAWLETMQPNLKPSSAAHYELLSTTYLRPTLGPGKLSKLAPRQVQALCSDIQGQGHHRTAQLVYHMLKQACDLAVRWRWLPANPCDGVLRPQYHAKRKVIWTPEELTAFLDGARGHWLYPLWMVAIGSGCRPGELLGLTWDAVDLVAGTIKVEHTLQRVRSEYFLGTPKTETGERVVALPTEAALALHKQRAQQAKWRAKAGTGWSNTWGLVFTGEAGEPIHRSVIAHALRHECERLGITPLTPHGLRHLHASLLLNEGLPLPAVSARLGHAHPGVTLEVYSHVIGRRDDAGAAAIGRALRGQG